MKIKKRYVAILCLIFIVGVVSAAVIKDGVKVTTANVVSLISNLILNDNYISNDGDDEGISIDNAGNVTVSGNFDAPTGEFTSLTIDGATTPSTIDTFVVNHTTATDDASATTIDSETTATTGTTHVGLDNDVSCSAVVTGTDQNIYGSYQNVVKTGLDTSANITTVAGSWNTASNTGSTAAGEKNTYGGYFSATGDVAGATTTYGLYSLATGADTNYSLFTESGEVEIRLAATEDFLIDARRTLRTDAFNAPLEIQLTSLTNNVTGFNLDYITTATTGTAAYGNMNALTCDQVVTADDQSMTGVYINCNKLGADTNTDTTTLYGFRSNTANTGADDFGTKNTYAAYFAASGDAAGTSTAYGIYASAASADTNWAGYFNGNTNVQGNITVSGTVDGVDIAGDVVTAAAVIVDHTLLKGDGGAKGVQDTGITVSDTNDVSGLTSLSVIRPVAAGDTFTLSHTLTAVTGLDTRCQSTTGYWNQIVTATAGSITGDFINVTKTGADTGNSQLDLWGDYIQMSNTGNLGTGIRNTYGSYITVTGDTGGTSTTYGLRVSASGADTNNSIYSGAGTVDIRLAGINAHKIIHAGNSIGTGFDYVYGATTTSDTCASLTSYHDESTTGPFKIYGHKVFTTEDNIKTAGDCEHVALLASATLRRVNTSTGTLTVYGAQLDGEQTVSADAGTRITYGAKCTATGHTNGASTTYGLYATASGADTNYAANFEQGDVMLGTSTTDTGVLKLVKGAQAGDPEATISLSSDANGNLTISTDTGDIFLTPVGNDTLLDSGLTVGSATEAGDNNLRVEGTSTLVGNATLSASLFAGGGTALKELVGGRTGIIQAEGLGASASSVSMIRNSNDAAAPYLMFGKSRGTSVANNTIVENGDSVGNISFCAADGTNMRSEVAQIIVTIDGAVDGANDTPGKIDLRTSADGAAVTTSALVIDSSQVIHFPAYGAGALSTDGAGTITASDKRIKTHISNYNDSTLKLVDKIQPVKFRYKSDEKAGRDEPRLGFYAQDVNKVVPEMGLYGKKMDMWNIDDRAMIAVLVNAVKELKANAEKQQSQIDILKLRVKSLENK